MSRIWIITACFFAFVIFSANGYANDSGLISGHVIYQSSYQCVSCAKILLYDFSGVKIDSTLTNESGFFKLDVLAGNYFISAEGHNLVKKYYPDEYLFKNADKIKVNIGQSISVNFSLINGGWISGGFNCQERDGGHGLITALKIDEPASGWYKSLELDGPFPSNYLIDGLLPGTYKILGRARGNGTLYYPGVEHYLDGAVLEVAANSGTTDISFGLSPVGWGTIQGQVIDKSTGIGIPNIVINAYQWQDFWQDPNLMTVPTGNQGVFSLQVPAGEYFLFASYPDQNNPSDLRAIYFNNRYDPFNADAINVQADSIEDAVNFAIDFTVRHDLSISGAISSSANNSGLGDVVVTALDYRTGYAVASAYSSHNGEFSINSLPSGQYLLMFSGAYIIPYFYDRVSNWQDGQLITLSNGSRQILSEAITQDYGNFGLAISGRITSGNLPLAGARVYAYPEGEENPVAFARSNSSGEYDIVNGLTPGSYIVLCDLYGYWAATYPEPITMNLIDNPMAENIDFHLRPVGGNIAAVPDRDISIELLPNYPNPFNAQTTIGLFSEYDSPQNIQLVVYNLLGQKVGEKGVTIEPGSNVARWGLDNFSSNVPSGVYFYKIAGTSKSCRMILLK